MKDNEFIELLNLYLDHEISEPDAARLEAEVQRNPARYRLYREYCQMHKACALLSPAAVGETPTAAVFEARPGRWANPFALGGFLAAAACATFLFLNRAPTTGPVSSQGTIAAETPAVSPTRDDAPSTPGSIGQTVSDSLGRSDFRSSLKTQTVRWNTSDLAVTPTSPNASLNWIEALELTSVPQVPIDSLRFETRTIPKDATRSFGSGQVEAPIEYNAIQFQR